MPAEAEAILRPIWLLGLLAWGDIANLTYYRSKAGVLTVIAKTWPTKPPSPLQTWQRARFSAAIAAWNLLTPAQRAQWHLACRRASLPMHGMDLYVHWHICGDTTAISTLERQTETSLLP